ncbi:hypothetical protein CKM354_001260200 [Cercospora kikuchii]|uniref:Zn(2)-C6 fungal-type domain-containing protein n=1 Tax=Cercospora kikuchii TaxID=84275 RepID=A0A9P3L2V7_9PEZI|nr:uncharacterized protein CKM354_001260200 [Cercospora kikuchii]GIZ49572.1 hypothetical protein CKM354_001260200 [Cercospora kikuchii]
MAIMSTPAATQHDKHLALTMNGGPYARFPPPPPAPGRQQQQQQQQPQANAYAYTNSPYSTVQYTSGLDTYNTPLPHLQQQQQPQQQQPPPQYFQTLPQGAPAKQRRQNARPQQQQQQHPPQQQPNSNLHHDDPPSLPSTPGNGPGAPPPERNSPPTTFEDDLMNALQNNGGNASQQHAQDDDDEEEDREVVTADDPVYQLPPPPESVYSCEAELEKAIHAWSMEHGYELVRRASKKNATGELYKRYYHCSKHGRGNSGKTPDKDKVRVNRKSQRIGCPMSLAAVSVDPHDPNGPWQIRLRKTHHNHPAVDPTELAGHRRRARFGAVEKAVDGLFDLNTSTSDVLKFLQRTHPDGLFKRTDVANMKLKYKKFGTCAHHGDNVQPVPPGKEHRLNTARKGGIASACMSCRSKRTKCDSVRPTCGTCAKSGSDCMYDHAPTARPAQQLALPSAPAQQHVTPTSSARSLGQATAGSSQTDAMQIDNPFSFDLGSDNNDTTTTSEQPASQAAHAQQVLANLQAFQQEHIKPSRLELGSSSVEVLACSTCGNGDSYRSAIPHPFSLGDDWRRYKDAFEGAAVRENCLDVLLGRKKEPERPKPLDGAATVDVEVHNEYIKQLAIFARRNEIVKLGFRETLAPALWNRFRSLRNAFEIWALLEDMCCPRGSEHAYACINEIFSITLAGCGGNLDNYIQSLDLKWAELNELSTMHESRRVNQQFGVSAAKAARQKAPPNSAFTEDALCFLFLRNLGPQYQNLATNMCKKNNIGGFGSGERCGFKDLWQQVKRSLEK